MEHPTMSKEPDAGDFANWPDAGGFANWIEIGLNVVKLAREMWPIPWTNVKVERAIDELHLGIVCDDKSFGTIRVVVTEKDQQPIALMEAPNAEYQEPKIFGNSTKLKKILLFELFQAGRCLREHARTGDGHYWTGFEYHLKNAIRIGR
jgi:hypothetical protein